jgi:hypothetical protein
MHNPNDGMRLKGATVVNVILPPPVTSAIPASTATPAVGTTPVASSVVSTTSAVQATPLLPGQTLNAQVSQILTNGNVRLTTMTGTVDIKPSIPLPIGIAVVIQVPQTGGPLKLTVPPSVMPVGSALEATAVGVGPDGQKLTTAAALLTTKSLSFLAEIGQSGVGKVNAFADGDVLSSNRVPAVSTNVSDVIHQIVGQAVKLAVTKQDSLGPLMSTLGQVMSLSAERQPLTLPPPPSNALVDSFFPQRVHPSGAEAIVDDILPKNIIRAAQNVLGMRFSLTEAVDQNDIRRALTQSGLFSTPPSGGAVNMPVQSNTPTVDAALRLLGFPLQSQATSPVAIERALKSLIIAQAVPNGETNSQRPPVQAGFAAGGGSGAAFVPQGITQPVVQAIAKLFGVALPAIPVSLDMLKTAVTRAAGSTSSSNQEAALPTSAGQGNGTTDLKSALTVLRHELLKWLGKDTNTQTAGVQAAGIATVRRPSPPRPNGVPTPQPGTEDNLPPDTAPRGIGEKILAQTEAALARQGLLQWASLSDGADRTHVRAEGQPTPMLFEMPILMNGHNAVIQFQLEQEGRNPGQEEQSSSWQARFAVAIEPLGAVHAAVTLRAGAANVTLWAERSETAALLRSQLLDLRDALSEADFDVHDLVCRFGSPASSEGVETPATGYFLDQKT